MDESCFLLLGFWLRIWREWKCGATCLRLRGAMSASQWTVLFSVSVHEIWIDSVHSRRRISERASMQSVQVERNTDRGEGALSVPHLSGRFHPVFLLWVNVDIDWILKAQEWPRAKPCRPFALRPETLHIHSRIRLPIVPKIYKKYLVSKLLPLA